MVGLSEAAKRPLFLLGRLRSSFQPSGSYLWAALILGVDVHDSWCDVGVPNLSLCALSDIRACEEKGREKNGVSDMI